MPMFLTRSSWRTASYMKKTSWILAKSEIHSSSIFSSGQEYRIKHGLPRNPNVYGALTDGPDYCFVDGRLTPPGTGKLRRALEQKLISEKVLQLSAEVDFAVLNHEERVKAKNEADRKSKSLRLKAKGNREFRVPGKNEC